jgi:hypothetical protein
VSRNRVFSLAHLRHASERSLGKLACQLFRLLLILSLAGMTLNAPAIEINIAQRQTPPTPIRDAGGATIDPSSLMWFETFSKSKLIMDETPSRAFGVRRDNEQLYVWDVGSFSNGSIYSNAICVTRLLNGTGQPVLGSTIVFLGVMDLDGTGNNDYLVAIQGNDQTNWTYVWKINDPSCSTNSTNVRLAIDGPLRNSSGTIVPARWLRHVVVGDFDRDGRDELRALQINGSWNYTWKLSPANASISHFRSGNLRNTAGAPVNVNDLTFVDVANFDGYGLNTTVQTALVGIQSGVWSYQWGLEENSIRDVPLCSSVNCSGRILMFSLDQGFSNGIGRFPPSAPGMRPVYDNIVSTLKAFQSKYTVYVLFNPHIANKADPSNLYEILDFFSTSGIPFYLEVYSSDNTTIANAQPALTNAADTANGIGPTVDTNGQGVVSLKDAHTRYGAMFAGIRFMEVGAQDLALNPCLLSLACAPPRENWLVREYFSVARAKPFVEFARDFQKSVLVVDQLWVAPWDTPIGWSPPDSVLRFRNGIAELAATFPNTMYVAYANNESYGSVIRSGLHRQNDWQRYLEFAGIKGIGLSNQSWMCDRKPGFSDTTCPVEYMNLWTGDALINKGASLVQFEPFWYLFNWPRGTLSDTVAASPPIGSGLPTPDMCAVAKSLAVRLNTCPL